MRGALYNTTKQDMQKQHIPCRALAIFNGRQTNDSPLRKHIMAILYKKESVFTIERKQGGPFSA